MNIYGKMLENLQSAMLEAESDKIIPSLKGNRPALNKRLDVYIAGYRTRLVQAVLSDYPALVHYLGKEEAEILALSYVESTPSTSYTLDTYPLKFAEYLAMNSSDGFAISVAKLESAIAEVFWLPDSEAFAPPQGLTPDQFMELCFAPRKASRFIHLEYPAEDYILAVRENKTTAALDQNPHYMLVVRHENEVKRHVIAKAEQAILSQLFTAIAVGRVLDEVTDSNPKLLPEIESNLQSWFVKWIGNGFFTKKVV